MKQNVSSKYFVEKAQQEQEEAHEEIQGKSVDEIFAEADEIMLQAKENQKKVYFAEKKSFSQRMKTSFKTLVVLVVLAVVGIVISAIYAGMQMLPQFQKTMLKGLESTKQELSKLKEDEMTVHQYYQLQFLNMFTDEEMEQITKSYVSLDNITSFINQSQEIDERHIPENKRDDFLEWKEQYDNALRKEDHE